MTRPDVLTWLAQRRPAAPPALAAHLAAAAAAAGSVESLPGDLVRLGQRLLARVTAAPAGGRELALDLLAADAFVTYGFEAQAEVEVDGLTMLAERVAAEGETEGGGGEAR